MKIAVLGSGSRGNATLLTTERTRVLIDAGFSARQLAKRLDDLEIEPSSIAAIVITHDHRDHTRGSGVFARRFGTRLFMTPATSAACATLLRGSEDLCFYDPGRRFVIGDLEIEPFLTVHDAVDPVAVTVTSSRCGTRVGIATDLGRPTAGTRHALSGCHFLVLEANHDETLLRTGPYPSSVQARIASSHGHLSNHAAAGFARELVHPFLSGIFLAHLSVECNRPELARDVVTRALKRAGWRGFLEVARQDRPTPLVDIRVLRAERASNQLSFL